MVKPTIGPEVTLARNGLTHEKIVVCSPYLTRSLRACPLWEQELRRVVGGKRAAGTPDLEGITNC